MKERDQLKHIAIHIKAIEKHTRELLNSSSGISSLECNLRRIRAVINILKLNFFDIDLILDDE